MIALRRGSRVWLQDRRWILTLALGIASGMPLLLTGSTLSWRLASEGIDITTIGLFALAGMPYAVKFLWAPLVDHGRWPLLEAKFGRRRAWLIVTLPALAAAIIVLGMIDPTRSIAAAAGAALAVSILSATLDTIIDAYRIETFPPHEQGKGAAATQLGYRIGLLISGAGALVASHRLDWDGVFLLMALILLACGLGGVILGQRLHRPRAAPRPRSRPTLQRILIAPLNHFIDGCAGDDERGRRIVIITLMISAVILYRASDAIAGMMATPLYHDLGFQAAEVASVSKVFGLIATSVGIIAGAWLVSRRGMIGALLLCGALQMLSNAMFAVLAALGRDIPFFIATIAVENLSGGMASAAFVAFLSALCRRQWAATQYALLSALAALGRTLFASGGGWIVDRFGWIDFFLATILASLPALLIFAALRQRLEGMLAHQERSFGRD